MSNFPSEKTESDEILRFPYIKTLLSKAVNNGAESES